MASFKIQETNDTIKSFNLNKDDPIQYQNQKIEIMQYIINTSNPIIESYGEFTIEAYPFKSHGKLSYWCGYLSCNDKNKIKDILDNRKIWGSWTYETEDKIGFDCTHYNDISFHTGIDYLDQYNNQELEEYTFKGPEWVLQQLKDVINLNNN